MEGWRPVEDLNALTGDGETLTADGGTPGSCAIGYSDDGRLERHRRGSGLRDNELT